jgi:PAS domain-containing protein
LAAREIESAVRVAARMADRTGPMPGRRVNGIANQFQPTAAFLTGLLDSVNDGVIVADLDGRFLVFNAAAHRILGQGPLQVPISEWTASYGAFLEDTVTPYPPEQLPLARALRGETVQESSVFIRNGPGADGVWLSINASPLRADGGDVSSSSGMSPRASANSSACSSCPPWSSRQPTPWW